MITVLLAPTLALAQSVEKPVLGVETEYGAMVLEGRLYTAAHHQPSGPYAGDHIVAGGRPCPCVDKNIPYVKNGVILISHFDLDTVGGVLRALDWEIFENLVGVDEFWAGQAGGRPDIEEFWKLAAFVDINGPHKLAKGPGGEVERAVLFAYWAWAKTRERFPRDVISDVTEEMKECGRVLCLLLRGATPGDEAERDELLAQGHKMLLQEQGLNVESFVDEFGGVCLRESDLFVNSLYITPSGVECRAVVAFSTKTGAITVSFADPIPGVSCMEEVQLLWGFEAGGRDNVAGSPRGKVMSNTDVAIMAAWLERRLQEPIRAFSDGWRCGPLSTAYFESGVMLARIMLQAPYHWEALNPDKNSKEKTLKGVSSTLEGAMLSSMKAAGI